MLPPAALLCTKFEFVPGSWRLTLSPHTVRSPRPTEAGCCHESQCTAVMCLWKQWQEDGPWDRPGTGLFRKYNGVGKRSALPYLDSQPIQWPPWCGQRTAALVVRSLVSPTSWPSCRERHWRTGLICEYKLSAQEKKAPVCLFHWTWKWEKELEIRVLEPGVLSQAGSKCTVPSR